MRYLTTILLLALTVGSFQLTPRKGWGQDNPPADDTRSELGVRQRLIERKMNELETKLTVIADRLKEKEPERAARLIAAYQASKEQLITRRMAEIGEKLDSNQLVAASQMLDDVIRNLEVLLKILVEQNEPQLNKQQEMEMLERWKEDIQQQMKEQQQQRRETEKAADQESAAEKLQAQIKKLEGLIEKQEKVIATTEKSEGEGLRALDQIADQQFEVRKETGELVDELSEQLGESDPTENQTESGSEGGAGKSDPSKNPQGESASKNPSPESEAGDAGSSSKEPPADERDDAAAEVDPAGEKEADGGQKDSAENSSDPKSQPAGSQSESQPAEGSQPAESQSPAQSQPQSQPQPQQAPQPGEQALEKAIGHQERAEERLGSGKTKEAAEQAKQALDEMQDALAELKKEKRRIESLPPDALEQLADQQRRMRDKALELIEEMKAAPVTDADGQQDSSETPPDGQPPAAPGQQPMEQASQSMQQAAEDLQKKSGDQAQQDQKKSAEQMQKAVDEIEERLNQLRDETRQEKLARLEARFQEMLDRQVIASTITLELEDKRTQLAKLQRRDQLTLLQLATEEAEIRELGQQAYDLLLEDGSSVVFPEIVQELREDLAKASRLLQDDRTDSFTQLIQQEIEITIQDLLDALKEAKQPPSEGGGGGGGGGGEQPLLKKSAELKILRSHQLRLNRRSIQIDRIRGGDLDPTLDQEAQQAAETQQRLILMLDEILQKGDQQQ